MSQTQKQTDELSAVADAIRSNDRFVVATHENPDGDALGSMLGVTLGLQKLGKDVVMYLSGDAPTPGEYRFLDLSAVQRELPGDLEERVLLAVDAANERRIGPEPPVERAKLVLDVDHHHDHSAVGAEEPYSEGIIDSLRAVEGSEMVALIREPPRTDGPARRVSLRSSHDEVDVSAIAAQAGGGGHRQAAGFSSELSVDEIIEFIRREFVATTQS